MKLYISTKKMTLDIEHEIVLNVSDTKCFGYDLNIDLKDDDKFIKDTLKEGIFKVREDKTWWSFPLYEIINGEIVKFDYTKYQYFADTDRRVALARKIKHLYNSSSETKILRKTFKYIMDTLEIPYPDFFQKYNDVIEAIIKKNPKN